MTTTNAGRLGPTVTTTLPLGLVSHLLWGGVLGVSYALLDTVPLLDGG